MGSLARFQRRGMADLRDKLLAVNSSLLEVGKGPGRLRVDAGGCTPENQAVA